MRPRALNGGKSNTKAWDCKCGLRWALYYTDTGKLMVAKRPQHRREGRCYCGQTLGSEVVA